MVEPLTVNRGLIVPNTGDLPGTWGSAAINPDMAAIDGMLGGFVTVSLTNTPVTLTVPGGFTATPSAGPTQAQNSFITFSGTLTANVTVTFPMPGYYIVNNVCTGAFVVILASSTPGNVICAPPGEAVHIFCDGTDMYYVNLGRVGTYIDLGVSAVPAWITNCTVKPYLNCDGTTFSAVTYPVLNGYLGGNTLPDLRGRTRVALNQGTGRVTSAVSGIDGNTLLSAGGDQNSQTHNHTASVTDPGHSHSFGSVIIYNGAGIGGGSNNVYQQNPSGGVSLTINTNTTGISVNNSAYGSGASQNMPPSTVAGITLIRAG